MSATRSATTPRRLRAGGVLLLAVLCSQVSSARVVRWALELQLDEDGSFRERRAVDVLLDDAEAVAEWQHDFVLLDSNRTLESYLTDIRRNGQRLSAEDASDRASLILDGEDWASRQVAVRSFHPARIGDRLEIVSVVVERPWYHGTVLVVPRSDLIDELTITIRSAPEQPLAWHVTPREEAEAGVTVRRDGDRLVLHAKSLSRSDEPLQLWLSWDDDPTWRGVADWFRELTADLPHLATEPSDFPLSDTTNGSPLVAEAIRTVQKEVRYAAVQMGVGGYRPTPAARTWDRRWGDCKDKATLVIERLRQRGVRGYPALVRSSWSEGIDAEVATPYAFNHMIVAVPTSALSGSHSDADGTESRSGHEWSFFDPTQEFGDVRWLHPGVQGQQALIVRPETEGGGVLVQIPRQPGNERRTLQVELKAGDTDLGPAAGRAVLDLRGAAAAQVLWSDDAPQAGRRLLEQALPSFEVGTVEVTASAEGVPRASVSAAVSGSSPWNGRGSLRLPDASSFGVVSPGSTERRALAGPSTVHWSVQLPADAASCSVSDRSQSRAGKVAGITGQEVELTRTASTVTVDVHRFTEPPETLQEPTPEQLEELARAERLLRRSRVRLDCGS